MAERINSWEELKQLRSNIKKETEANSGRTVIAVGTGTCGVASGANDIMAAIKDEIEKAGVKDTIVVPTGCYGLCYAEPMVEVRVKKNDAGKNTIYGHVDDALARDIVRRHIVNGEPIEDSIIKQEVERA